MTSLQVLSVHRHFKIPMKYYSSITKWAIHKYLISAITSTKQHGFGWIWRKKCWLKKVSGTHLNRSFFTSSHFLISDLRNLANSFRGSFLTVSTGFSHSEICFIFAGRFHKIHFPWPWTSRQFQWKIRTNDRNTRWTNITLT